MKSPASTLTIGFGSTIHGARVHLGLQRGGAPYSRRDSRSADTSGAVRGHHRDQPRPRSTSAGRHARPTDAEEMKSGALSGQTRTRSHWQSKSRPAPAPSRRRRSRVALPASAIVLSCPLVRLQARAGIFTLPVPHGRSVRRQSCECANSGHIFDAEGWPNGQKYSGLEFCAAPRHVK